jgi:RNA polymerase sigma-70 factor, ECF subfamily
MDASKAERIDDSSKKDGQISMPRGGASLQTGGPADSKVGFLMGLAAKRLTKPHWPRYAVAAKPARRDIEPLKFPAQPPAQPARTWEESRSSVAETISDNIAGDNELLERHLKGDAQAFPELVNRYRRELLNFLIRFTGDEALAEDVFQETFLQLYVSASAFDPTRRLKPWLFTIAANKARDAMRSRQRRQAAPLDAAMSGSHDDGTTYIDLMPSDVPQPDQNLENTETRAAVQKIVAEMPDNLRVVLLLSYFNEFPYKEIADMLNLPLGTVKSRLHAAVKYFAKRWKAIAGRVGYGKEEFE